MLIFFMHFSDFTIFFYQHSVNICISLRNAAGGRGPAQRASVKGTVEKFAARVVSWGRITAEDEKKLLSGVADGTFLLRVSKGEPGYTLAGYHSKATNALNGLWKKKVQRQGDRGWKVTKVDGVCGPFVTVVDLVRALSRDSSMAFGLPWLLLLQKPVVDAGVARAPNSQGTITDDMYSRCV